MVEINFISIIPILATLQLVTNCDQTKYDVYQLFYRGLGHFYYVQDAWLINSSHLISGYFQVQEYRTK